MKQTMKKLSFTMFRGLDRVGLHLLPKHYYSCVPDRAWLMRNGELWRKQMPMRGVSWELDGQLAWLQEICRPYREEVAGLDAYRALSRRVGAGYGEIESQVLHCFVRATRPARVVEVGAGMSTATILNASDRNQAEGLGQSRITCVEPFPRPGLRELMPRLDLVPAMAQAAPCDVFEGLRAGDLLFIDSTHVVKLGSELPRLYLEVIPALPPGVYIHVHDISLPYLFQPGAMSTYFDWQESTLLLALLTGNPSLRVLSCLSALHADRQRELQELLPDYTPQLTKDGLEAAPGHFPSSLWMVTR